MPDAEQKIEQWRTDYNEFRPHSSLNGLTPSELEDKEMKLNAEFSNKVCPNNGGISLEIKSS